MSRTTFVVATISCAVAVAAPAMPAMARRPATTKAIDQGFKLLADGSELFLKLDRIPQTPLLREAKDGLELVIPKARAKKRFRHLEPRYFPTPVRTMELRQQGADLIVHVVLKQPVEPKLEVTQDKNGATVKLVFPPGQPDVEPPPRPAKAAGTAEDDRDGGGSGDGQPDPAGDIAADTDDKDSLEETEGQ
ncbi:MAG: hypothetical protein V2A73_07395 [Pseudomonadota bacterium]